MTENEARKAAKKIVEYIWCGAGSPSHMEDSITQIILAAQPEPPAGLREAVETLVTTFTEFWDDRDVPQPKRREAVALVLSAVEPVVEEYRDMIRRFVAINGAIDQLDSPCGILHERDSLVVEARALIGGDDG